MTPLSFELNLIALETDYHLIVSRIDHSFLALNHRMQRLHLLQDYYCAKPSLKYPCHPNSRFLIKLLSLVIISFA